MGDHTGGLPAAFRALLHDWLEGGSHQGTL